MMSDRSLALTKKSPSTFSPKGRLQRKVGVTGFEPATSSSRTTRSTKLSYTPSVIGPVSRKRRPAFAGTREWAREDSNLRRRTPTGLQPVPFGHLGTRPDKTGTVPDRPAWGKNGTSHWIHSTAQHLSHGAAPTFSSQAGDCTPETPMSTRSADTTARLAHPPPEIGRWAVQIATA